MNNFLLDILSLGAIFSGILVITSKNPVISVLYLIVVFVNVAGYLVLLGVSFIGISYLIVYIGAVTVLFLFVIIMLNLQLTELTQIGSEYTKNLPLGGIMGTLFLFEIVTIIPSIYTTNKTNFINQLGFNFINTLNTKSIGVDNILIDIKHTFQNISPDTQFSNFIQVETIGFNLYSDGAFWLIITSFVLLLAIVGPISLTPGGHNTK